MIVRRNLIPERHPRRGEDSIRRIENEGPNQEEPEIEHLALPVWQLPDRHEHEADGNGTDKNVRPAAPPATARIVRDVSHDRIGEGVEEARD